MATVDISTAIAGLERLEGVRCLVTGGAGYLGGYLVDALVRLGASVRTLDVVSSRAPRTGVEALVGDVTRFATVQRAVEDIDVVFHTAAAMCFAGLVPPKRLAQVFAVNVQGTRNVVAACCSGDVSALVHTSSANVVIDRELLEADESTPYGVHFVDLYSETKAQAERDVLAADNDGVLRTIALRPGGLWGPGAGGYMVQAFVDELAAGRFVATIGDGRAVVDNTHVLSLVRAELQAAQALLEKPEVVGGQAYFITDDERLNGIEWFRPLAEGLGYRFPKRHLPGRLMYGVAWAMELAHAAGGPEPTLTRMGIDKLCRSSAFCIDRARADLGYVPLVDRDTGIAAHLEDYRALHDAHKASS